MAKIKSSSIRSEVAAVSVPLRERLKGAQGGWWVTAITVGALAAGFIPFGIGAAVGLAADRYRNHLVADRQEAVLADHYRDSVAATLGIDPQSVSAGQLRQAARVNPMLASAISKVEMEKDSANRAALLASGASGALGVATGIGFIPVLSFIPHLAAHAAATMAGVGVSSLFDKDILTAHDMMEHLDEKQTRGETITPNDVMLLRIAQDEAWQKAFAKQYGVAFHKMTEAQQQSVMNSLPNAMYAEAKESAEKVANGRIKVADLLMPGVVANDNPPPMEVPKAANENQPPDWRTRMGGPKAASGSFTERLGGRPASFTAAQEAREAAAQTTQIS